MADATVRIEPDVLAAALREVEGVVVDPSTEEGARAGALIIERLLADPESAEKLLSAVERHAEAGADVATKFPDVYDPVETVDSTSTRGVSRAAPPIGSAEFDAYMDETAPELVTEDEESAITAMPVAEPRELGFAVDAAAPPPRAEVDAALRDAQRLFEVKLQGPHTFRTRFKAAVDVLMDRGEREWDVVALPLARNRFVVQLKRQNERWRWESIAAGDWLYVLVVTDGRLAFKDRLSLTDLDATKERLEAAFASEPSAGARTLRALRLAMTGPAGLPPEVRQVQGA